MHTNMIALPVRAENADAVGYVSTTPEEGLAQLALLIGRGCKPHHFVLEIGCGALVAGFPIMQYLNVGGYAGVDPNEWLREASQGLPEVEAVVRRKIPSLYTRSDFRTDDGWKFNFIVSHSILSHASDRQLTEFFAAAADQLADGGELLASIRLADGNEFGSPGSAQHGADFAEWQYPGVSWFTREEVVERARRAGLSVEVSPALTRTIMSGNPKAIHDWIVVRRASEVVSTRLRFVTGFFRLNDRVLDEHDHFRRFDQLAASGLPILLFLDERLMDKAPRASNVTVVPTKLGSLWPFAQAGDRELALPGERNPDKDTRDFLLLQHAKLDILAMARDMDARSTHFAWIDFGIMKVVRDPVLFLNRLGRMSPPRDRVIAPGCWDNDRARSASEHAVNWRFCGGFLIADRDSVPGLVAGYHVVFNQRMARQQPPQLTWEVNTWADMERAGQRFAWYLADHDDSIVGVHRADAAPRNTGVTGPAGVTRRAIPIFVGIPCFREDADLLRNSIWSALGSLTRVVVVDNGSSGECKRVLDEFPKSIEVVTNRENLYVNAAWNQLAQRFLVSGADILVIMNADAILSPDWAEHLVRATKDGIALWRGVGVRERADLTDPHAVPTGHSAGVFFALRREDVVRCFPIPRELKIWYGDTWIFDMLKHLGRREVEIGDVRVWHASGMSSSRTPELADMVQRDKVLWDAYLAEACRISADRSRAGAAPLDPIELRYEAVRAQLSDINEHLALLRELAHGCDHVTEFGVGRSTYALAAARPNVLRCYDPTPDIGRCFSGEILDMAFVEGVDMQFRQESDLEVEIEPTDILFIDTIHTYGQLSQELRLHASKVTKYIVMHDTETFGRVGEDGTALGLQSAIDAFLAKNGEWRVERQLKNNNGLTVLERSPNRYRESANATTISKNRSAALVDFVPHAKSATELFGAREREIGWRPDDGWMPMNPSVCIGADGRRFAIVRTVNYRLDRGGSKIDGSDNYRSRNYVLEFGEDWNVLRATQIEDLTGVLRCHDGFRVHGFEDCRMWVGDDDVYYASASVRAICPELNYQCSLYGSCEMAILRLDAQWCDSFYFAKVGVEFCVGLARDPKSGELVASFGSGDASAHLAFFDSSRIEDGMRAHTTKPTRVEHTDPGDKPTHLCTVKRVCLCMIVKNESAIIERCLESALPHVDSWVIADTGSTDGTPEKIERFFAFRGVPGRLVRTTFRDFAQARNEALDAARAVPGWDYALLVDADMVVTGTLDRGALTAPAYNVSQRSGDLEYVNTRLVRRDVPARYVGVTHEFLSVEGVADLKTIVIDDRNDGGSRSDKGDRDIRLLSDGLAQEPNNERYMFYLAQTYRGTGRHHEAIQWYRRRIERGGWDEEVWFSHYGIAQSYKELGDEPNFIKACLDAYDHRPSRGEPLKLLAKHLREKGRNESATMIAEELQRIKPPGDLLFVERDVHDYGADQELSIAGYYSKLPRRREAGYVACAELTVHPVHHVREEARRNFTHYVRSAHDLFGAEVRPIEWGPDDGYAPMNPSVCVGEGRRLAVVRTVNYTVADGQYPTIDGSGVIRTRNYVVEFDEQWKPVRSTMVKDATGRARSEFPVDGFEDCRLWRDGRFGTYHLSATVRDSADNPGGQCEMAIALLDKQWRMIAVDYIRDYERERPQKNWMPIAGRARYFVYLCDPTIVVGWAGNTFELSRSEPPFYLGDLRGGSQLVPHEDGWICLTHEVAWRPERVYMHRFVKFDSKLRVIAIGDPFYFAKVGIEFCAGLAHDGDRLVASFGVNDASAHLAFFDPARVDSAMFGVNRK